MRRAYSPNGRSTRKRARSSIRPRRRRRGSEGEVLRVDGGPDRRQRLALGLHPHHVTRDVQTQRSRRGVAGEGDAAGPFVLHVAGAVRGVAELVAAAGARHPGERVRVVDREGVEAGRGPRPPANPPPSTGPPRAFATAGTRGGTRRAVPPPPRPTPRPTPPEPGGG